MDAEGWQGLTVRAHDGSMVGIVVGVFTHGLLAGRLRVHARDFGPHLSSMGPTT